MTQPAGTPDDSPNSVTGSLRECRGIVISKCANPECSASFRYLHEGKLFEFEVRLFDEPLIDHSTASHYQKPSREIECFWLCDSCASTMTIVCEPNTHRIVIVPLQDDVRRRFSAKGASAGEPSSEDQHNANSAEFHG